MRISDPNDKKAGKPARRIRGAADIPSPPRNFVFRGLGFCTEEESLRKIRESRSRDSKDARTRSSSVQIAISETVEFFLSKTITHFITDKQQPVDSTGGGVAIVAAQTGEWNEEHQPQATTTPGTSVYHRIAVAASPSSSAPATRSSLTNVANRRSQQPGRRSSARNTYHTYHPTPREYNRGQYVNDIGSATSRTSSPCPPPASTTPTLPPATSSTSLAGHVRQQQQKQQLGATAFASSSAGGGHSPSTAATPLATATLGFDGRVKPTQPAALPRSRADAMLQRVRQQQQQQQQHQQHQPHHQPSYHLLPSSPLKYNISSPSAVTTISHSAATPIKRSDTPSPSTFNNPSSHHKHQPASPCYSPVPAPGTAGGEGWWEHVTRSVAPPTQNSPIQLASSWGTPVWSPEHALKFLRKVLDSVRNENHPEHKHRHHHQGHQQHHHHRSVTSGSTRASSSSRHAHHLHGRFLKVESISSATAYRPFYQEFKQWPDLLLVRRQTPDLGEKKAPFADVHELPKAAALKVTEASASPVTTEVTSGARMTRKLNARTSAMVTSARSASVQEQKPSTPNTAKKRAVTLLQKACETAANEGKKDKTAPAPPKDCGYCEICRIEYDSLALHVDSESHRTFVQNDENFQSLDQLIGSIGEFGGNTNDGEDGGQIGLLGGLLVDNRRDDCGVGAAGGIESPAAAAAGDGGGLSLHHKNNETDERLQQLMEAGPQAGKRRNSLDTATVKTTVTTTTTAAVDEQQIDKATELHRTIKATSNSSRKLRLATSVAIGEQQEQQRLDLQHNRIVKQGSEIEASYDETKVNSSCIAKAPKSDAKQRLSAKRPAVKEQTEEFAEPIGHGAVDSIGDSVPQEESTLKDQRKSSLIKRAIASVIASFDADSDDEDDESDSLVASDHKKPALSVNPVGSVKKTRKTCAAASVLESGSSREISVVSEEADCGGKKAKSECAVEQFIDFVVEGRDDQCAGRQGRGRSTKQVVTGVAVHTTRRSSRTSCAVIEEPVPSRTEEVQRSIDSLTTEQAQESGGMFGRRSAIHHHPHNQLNHHKHQKHKSTLSALLLKQQQERQQQLLEEAQKRRDATRVESNCEAQLNVSSDQAPCHDPDDHAAGMKVIGDFRREQQSAELQKFSSEVTGVGLDQKLKPSVGRRKRGRGAGTVAIGHHRRQQQQQQQQLEAPECQKKALSVAMGLKASTTAMNKHHHHHHHHHLSHVDGASDVVDGLGAKTRLAETALLECEGLDPKNTKRISLGLRQNPKRANLNEDFTSLLDETLERSRLISSSSSSSAATTTSATPSAVTSTVVARKAQARIRQLQHKTKDKEKAGKRKERTDVDTNEPATPSLEQQSISSSAGMKRGSTKKVGSAALEDIKVRGIRWRAPSPASRPPVKSPLLYKVIEPSMPPVAAGNDEEAADATISRTVDHGEHDAMMASKGERKVSAHSNRLRKTKSDQQQQCSPTKNGLIVKIRRVRQSELSLLNDEAENFMFPKKDESSSDSDTDDGRQTSSEGCRAIGAEAGGAGPTRNNFSLDIPSSSELERTSKCVEEEDEEDDHDAEVEHDGRTTGAAAKGCRKRRKPSSSNKLQADARNRRVSVESEPSSCASSSSGSSFVIEPIVKRARFDSQLMTNEANSSTKSGRRKASFGAAGVFDDGSDPPGSRTRFPAAPIQPTPVAVDERMTSTTTGGKHSYDKDDDNADDEVKYNNAKKRVPSFGRGRGKKGRLRQVKQTEKENPQSSDLLEKDEIPDSVVPLREDSVSSPSQLSTCTCYNAGNGSSNGAVRNRGRGSGRGGSRRGRRGRGGAASVAARSWAARGRGGRMPLCGCRLQLLDATRMPPPASPVSPGHQDALESRSDSSGPPSVLGSRRSGASKTKTTPPASKSRRGALARTGQDELDHQQPHESSLLSTEAISGSYSIASNSSSNKGKEDGMGAVFKWINFRKRCEEIEPYRFAFERVPSLEPWYETFQRQDDSTEQVYEYFGSTGYRKLPYEMGPLPALSQNCCILNYKVVACRKSNRTASQQSFSPSSVEPSSPSSKYRTAPSSEGPSGDLDSKKSPSSSLSSLPLKKRKLLLAEGAGNSNSITTNTGNSGASGSSGAGDGSGGSSGNRIARLIAGSDRPRKSPREHASTLAILSLLSQQQHRKRAAAIKILTSPKKTTTTTAQSLLASQEKHQQQDTDSNSGHGDEQQRPSSVTDRSGSGGVSGTSIKFERPLFPDSTYINSRNLCKELDAFLSEELEQVCGASSVMQALDEKQEERPTENKDATLEQPASNQRIEMNRDQPPALQLPLSPSVLREGVAIERQQLPVSKRDLLDVLQTVGREPPLSLKLVQRCETVVKKIVQFDRKPRSMLASNGGYGGAVIGLQLFDGTSSSAFGCSGSGLGGGVGHGVAACAGGSVLKKRINRTGWPTNKRKIGTRTRQQSRFLRPMMLSASSAESKQTASEDVGEESVPVIKKEKDDEDGEEDEEEDPSEGQRDDVVESQQVRHEADEDDEEEDSGPEDDEEEDVEEEEEEDDGETVIEMAQRRRGRPPTVSCKNAGTRGKVNDSSNVLAGHGKVERRNPHQTNNSPDRVTEAERPSKVSLGMETAEQQQQQFHRRRSRKSSGSSNATTVAVVGNSECVAVERKADSAAQQQATTSQDATEQRRPPISSSFYDTMPTLRAALMRDNSQQLQRQLSRSLGTTQPSPTSTVSSLPISSPLSLTLPPPAPKISPTVGQQTLWNSSPAKPADPSAQQLLSPGSRMATSGVVGTACSKYVTKTTTTMTRVDYTGGPGGGCVSNTESGGAPTCNRATNSSKPKRKSRDISRNEEATGSQRLAADDVGSSTNTIVRMNRYPAQRWSTTNNTIDDDDKECDSISSRSIFVSDDCDTTSSSTMVNAPSEDAPHPVVDQKSLTTAARHDESATAEDEEDENEKEHQSRSVVAVAAALQRSPRTPSERIRNKLVAKNRRMSALFKRRLSTTTTSSPARVVKLSPAKLNVLSNSTQATVPPKRRGMTKPIHSVTLPPPSMMPLSPPLTTSTSSSSSSCADDKPMSPAVAAAPVLSHTSTSTGNAGICTPQPSKVKTRSATKGRPPTRRTYSATNSGRGKTKNASMVMMDHLNTTSGCAIRLPFVSLVKTTFTGIDKESSMMTIANTSAISTTSATTTTASAATTIDKSSPKRKGAKGTKETKQNRRAKLVNRGASSKGKSRSPRKQQRKVPPPATERLVADAEMLEEEPDEEEEEEDAVPIVKVRRRKQIIAKREDDGRLDGDYLTKLTDDGDEHPIAQEHKPTKRKQQLKLKVFNHGNHHYTYDSSFSVTTATTESSKTAQVERISNGILEHRKEECPDGQQQNVDDGENGNEGAKHHDSNVMSSEVDEPAQPDADEQQLEEEHLIEDEHEDHEEEDEDEEHLLDTEVSDDDGIGDKGSTKIEMLELMEVVENQEEAEADHHHDEGDEGYDHRQQQQQDVLNEHDGDDEEDTFLTGDEVEVEEQEEEEDLAELERSATRIMNNDHPYANSSEDLSYRHQQRYNHRHHHHHDRDHHSVTTDEEEPEYVEVHEFEAEVEEEEEEELDAVDEDATSSHVGGEEDHLHQLCDDEEDEEDELDETEATQRTLHPPLSSNSHIVTGARSLNSSTAKTSSVTAAATTTTSPNKYSPRKLRKPRGRWYRER
ncbi:hypothetical protein AND_009310 [Anopheles darlingi]|uniref:DBF4-type domain-containing protein n=1 Tax=Anopheles darlingi TaxID=43151 RepID=W5J6Q7_ANODA|nr:hypothetical protein AND_009310 [Anopheles darlingi]